MKELYTLHFRLYGGEVMIYGTLKQAKSAQQHFVRCINERRELLGEGGPDIDSDEPTVVEVGYGLRDTPCMPTTPIPIENSTEY